MYFWAPQSGSMGIGVSVLTYAGQVYVGMIADRSLVPEPQQVVDLFAPEFEQLRRSLGGRPAVKRGKRPRQMRRGTRQRAD
jgi:hypothetical protein